MGSFRLNAGHRGENQITMWKIDVTDSSRPDLHRFAERLRALINAKDDGAVLGCLTIVRSASPVAGEVSIGLGTWGGGDGTGDPAGICLNYKGTGARFQTECQSVVDLVLDAPAELDRHWRSQASCFSDVDGFLRGATFFVEDASPDSVMGLFCFLARFFGGIAPETFPASWPLYVRRWEAGEVGHISEAERAWFCLASALTHTRLRGAGGANPLGAQVWQAIWRENLTYLCELVMSDQDPCDIADDFSSLMHRKARVCLSYERAQYGRLLDSAQKLQLVLPLRDLPDCTRLVDAALLTEHVEFSGTLKVMLRTDTLHSWSRQGFTVLGLHRPGLEGTGYDMTVSLDPTAGVHLERLWLRLEELEDLRWGDARPRDNPRNGLSRKYPVTANQPWWNGGNDKFDMIAAPKSVCVNGATLPGSSLSWQEVCDELWDMYNPGVDAQIEIEDDSGVRSQRRLIECCATSRPDGGRYAALHWAHRKLPTPPLSPTLQRLLAAIVAREETALPIRFCDLPEPEDFDFFNVPGGCAVVHAKGIVLFNDWRERELDVTALRAQYDGAMKRKDLVDRKCAELNQVLADAERLLETGKGSEERLIDQMAELKAEVALGMRVTAPVELIASLAAFRDAIERRLGIAGEVDRLYADTERLQQSLAALSEARTNTLIQRLSIYGFPLFLFSQLLSSFSILDGRPEWSVRLFGIDTHLQVHWWAVLLFFALAVLGIGTLWVALRVSHQRKRKRGSRSHEASSSR